MVILLWASKFGISKSVKLRNRKVKTFRGAIYLAVDGTFTEFKLFVKKFEFNHKTSIVSKVDKNTHSIIKYAIISALLRVI